MKTVFIFIIGVHLLQAQKVIQKSISAASITSIQVDTNNCFDVTLETIDADLIMVEAIMDGEYEEEQVLRMVKAGRELEIGTSFQPNFEVPNDKLSAHKVISIALKIKLPKHKNLQIFGTNANVKLIGDYNYIKVTLNDGNCVFDRVKTNAEVHTQSGDIHIRDTYAEVIGISKYGSVLGKGVSLSDYRMNLTTVTGNIYLNKTE